MAVLSWHRLSIDLTRQVREQRDRIEELESELAYATADRDRYWGELCRCRRILWGETDRANQLNWFAEYVIGIIAALELVLDEAPE